MSIDLNNVPRPIVPRVRITKVHCYCKHSVLCIG